MVLDKTGGGGRGVQLLVEDEIVLSRYEHEVRSIQQSNMHENQRGRRRHESQKYASSYEVQNSVGGRLSPAHPYYPPGQQQLAFSPAGGGGAGAPSPPPIMGGVPPQPPYGMPGASPNISVAQYEGPLGPQQHLVRGPPAPVHLSPRGHAVLSPQPVGGGPPRPPVLGGAQYPYYGMSPGGAAGGVILAPPTFGLPGGLGAAIMPPQIIMSSPSVGPPGAPGGSLLPAPPGVGPPRGPQQFPATVQQAATQAQQQQTAAQRQQVMNDPNINEKELLRQFNHISEENLKNPFVSCRPGVQNSPPASACGVRPAMMLFTPVGTTVAGAGPLAPSPGAPPPGPSVHQPQSLSPVLTLSDRGSPRSESGASRASPQTI